MKLFNLWTIDLIDQDKDLQEQVQENTALFIGKGASVVKDAAIITKAVGLGVMKGVGMSLTNDARVKELEARILELENK